MKLSAIGMKIAQKIEEGTHDGEFNKRCLSHIRNQSQVHEILLQMGYWLKSSHNPHLYINRQAMR